MIKNFIGQIMDKANPTARRRRFGKRVEIGPEGHGINPALVDDRATGVVRTLKEAGHEAYIVGGAVRDLLLGLKPKDFDVATDATPEQVKALFRRAFIIGRRFRIVHVVFGRGREHEVIEVSTFRAFLDNSEAKQVSGNERTSKAQLAGMTHAVDASGRVLRDNVWGPQDEDAARRDFTVNALYYDPQERLLVDYHSGLADMQKKRLRMIGDPATRYREDPVRVIRAVRFAAKLSRLGFKLDPKTARPLVEARDLLVEVPQSRLFDEMLKLLQTGHAMASIDELKKLKLERGIYPLLDLVVERAEQPFVKAALLDTDRRVSENKPVAPSFLLACVLWQDVLAGWQQNLESGQHNVPALKQAIDDVFDARVGDVSGRGRLASDMREIWMMQPRFERRSGKGPFSLVEQGRFRAAFDFMRLRADVGEVDEELLDWWQAFSLAEDPVREDLLEHARGERQRSRKKSSRGRRGAREDTAATLTADQDEKPSPATTKKTHRPAAKREAGAADAGEAGTPTTKKRRRRRRKPSGSSAQAGKSEGDTGNDKSTHDD